MAGSEFQSLGVIGMNGVGKSASSVFIQFDSEGVELFLLYHTGYGQV